MGNPSDSISGFFQGDHRSCDDAWARVEESASQHDPAQMHAAWTQFAHLMQRHFGWEEDVLFPALENATGMRGGPTAVMRQEHVQMRGLLAQMQQAADRNDFDGLLNDGDTLLMVIQQHNAKEEGILYPMADQALGADWPRLKSQLRST